MHVSILIHKNRTNEYSQMYGHDDDARLLESIVCAANCP